MKPIRILHMIGSLNTGGSQTMVINLYRKINRDKIQFDFILDHSDEVMYKDIVESLGARVYYMPTFHGTNMLEIIAAWNIFFDDHPEYKVLHSHVRSYASIYFHIAHKHGVKTIIHSHSTSNGKGLSSFVKKCLQYPLRYQADYLLACSKRAGEWLYGKKACKKSNYKLIPNAIEVSRCKFDNNIREAYRNELMIHDKFVIGHVGRFHEAKNHEFLLRIFKVVEAKRKDAVLLLVGDGELKDSIEKKIESLELGNKIVMLGNRSDVPELMQAMDVFVFPSLWEGLGIVAIEAQATGLPVVASDQVPIETKIGDTIAYLSLENNDEEWADKILRCDIVRDRAVGYQNVCSVGYNIADVAEKMVGLYEKMWGL